MLIKQYLSYKILKYILRIIGIIVACLVLLFVIGWGISMYQPEVNNNITEFVTNFIPQSIFDLADNIFTTVKNIITNLFWRR